MKRILIVATIAITACGGDPFTATEPVIITPDSGSDTNDDGSIDVASIDSAMDVHSNINMDASKDVVDEVIDNSMQTAQGYCHWGFKCQQQFPTIGFTSTYGTEANCIASVQASLQISGVHCADACEIGLFSETCVALELKFPDACQSCCQNNSGMYCH